MNYEEGYRATKKESLFSGTVTVLPITSKNVQKGYPFEAFLRKGEGNLPKNSKAKADQVRTLDKDRIIKVIGLLKENRMQEIESALKIHLDLT